MTADIILRRKGTGRGLEKLASVQEPTQGCRAG